VSGLREAARIAPSLTRGFWVTVALANLGAIGALIVPLLLQQLVDQQLLTEQGPDVARAGRLALLAGSAAVVAGLASWQAMFRLVRAAAHGLTELRARVFGHLHRLPTLTVAGERRGALVARVTSDIEAVTQFMDWGGIAVLVGLSQLDVVPALMVREWLLRGPAVGAVGLTAWAGVCFAAAFSAAYEIFEWGSAILLGQAADAFLGSQGFVWDTQADMLCAFLGAAFAMWVLGPGHRRSLAELRPVA
jgi:putative ABC transport system ATP-binding protein